MMSYLNCLVVVLLFASNASRVRGSSINFHTSSSAIQPLLTSNFTLRCGLSDTSGSVVGRSLPDDVSTRDDTLTGSQDTDDILDYKTAASQRSVTQTTDNMAFVTSIIISRDGLDLAIVTEHLAARAEDGMTGFLVSGQVTGSSGERGYLELVWPHPLQSEIGNYRCDIDTLSQKGHSFDFSQSLEIDVLNVSINDLVSYVHGLTLEKEEMSKTIQEMAKTDKALKTENEALKQSIEALKSIARTEPKIFFSAIVTTNTLEVASGTNIKFDKLFTNEGSAYNYQTGIFTAPLAGFYTFDIHVHTISSRYAYFVIRHNGTDVVALYCYGRDHTDCSKSMILKLAKNDRIEVVSRTNSYIWQNGPSYRGTIFSGQLIALA